MPRVAPQKNGPNVKKFQLDFNTFATLFECYRRVIMERRIMSHVGEARVPKRALGAAWKHLQIRHPLV